MTLNQLRYFCAAARNHSITQAAKSLFVTQPTVSIAIRDLEKEFGLTLFSYSRNRLELTGEGALFYERAQHLLEASEDMQAYFSDHTNFRPTVRMGIPPMLSAIFFPELMDRFHEEYPDIYLELSEYGSMRACQMVQDEQLDIGLVNMEIYDIDKFAHQTLTDDRLVFCVSPNHHLANVKELTLEQLDAEPLILFNHDSVQNRMLLSQFHALGVHPRIILHCSQITTTMKFIRQGKCGAFFFASMLPTLTEVVGIPVVPEIPVKLGLFWKRGKYLSSYTQALIQFCKKNSLENTGIG